MILRLRMIFFNYETIYLAARGNPGLIIDYFKSGKSKGQNWVLKPKELMGTLVSDRHKAECIGLMSLRSYANYLQAKDTSLALELIPPWIPQSILTENPLIQLTDTRIIFVTEK